MQEDYVFKLLRHAYSCGASDIHLINDQSPVFRINGDMEPLKNYPPLSLDDLYDITHQLMYEPEHLINLKAKKHIDFSFPFEDYGRVRVNVYQQKNTLAASLRLIPNIIPDIHTLGIPIKDFDSLLSGGGLILVSGVTGSGKTTTLAAMIEFINQRRKCMIITLEDPIEYVHIHNQSLISQREVGTDTPTFYDGLTSALRQDPDVILVGEMRDLETIAIALTAAETGHLILATIHSGDSLQAIERIIDVFPAHQQNQVKFQLASTLRAVIYQQLIPRLDKSGRTLACEVLIVNKAIKNMIRRDKVFQITSSIQTGSNLGMITMQQSLSNLLSQGVISRDEAERRTIAIGQN